jgi:hypothetical protein
MAARYVGARATNDPQIANDIASILELAVELSDELLDALEREKVAS